MPVPAAIRAGNDLTASEAATSEQGEVESLFRLHNGLDATVADAYGWPVDLSDEEILQRLFYLNQERAREEKGGIIRRVGSE